MNTYCLTFTVNGKRTEQVVRAHDIMAAPSTSSAPATSIDNENILV